MGATVSYLAGSAGPNGFGAGSTAEDVTRGLNLEKLTIMITGGCKLPAATCTQIRSQWGNFAWLPFEGAS